jgi:3-mercaptopyruvate sulfurtransferase SseA
MFKISKTAVVSLLFMVLAALLTGCGPSPGSEVPRVDKDTVKGWLDDPEVMIIDVRSSGDWTGSDKKIKGAVRQDANKVDSWAPGLSKEEKIVLYCA